MKKIAATGLVIGAFIFGITSCNQQQGAVEEAQQVNEQRAEGSGQQEQITNLSDFMTKAASSNMLDKQAGQLAQEKGLNEDVKLYGQMMVSDHQKASDQLRTLAQQKNIVLPDSMSQEHMDKMKELRSKSGAEFDRAFMDLMLGSHEEAVSLFEDASNNVEDQEVKSFASTTLPALRQHRDRAEELDKKLNADTNAGTPTDQ